MRTQLCRCRRPMLSTVNGDWVCGESHVSRTECEAPLLMFGSVQPSELSTEPKNDGEISDAERWSLAIDDGNVGELVEMAAELKISSTYVAISLREADWCEQVVQDVLAEMHGGNPRDAELAFEGTIDNGPEIRSIREKKIMSNPKNETTTTAPMSQAATVTQLPPAAAKGSGQHPDDHAETKRVDQDAMAGGFVPRATWCGIPLMNPTSILLAEKFGKDIEEGRIDPRNAVNRIELLMATDLILKFESWQGRIAFLLNNLLGQKNSGRLIGRILGDGGAVRETAPQRPVLKAGY